MASTDTSTAANTESLNPTLTHQHFVSWIRSVAPYIHQFQGQTFVIAFGGEMLQAGVLDRLAYDLALLNALGIQLVLVHGIRPQVTAQLQQQGIQPQFQHNLRVTDIHTLATVKDCAGSVRLEIEAAFSQNLPNTPMHGARVRIVSGNFISARPVGIIDGIDFQYTGMVRKIDTESINFALKHHSIVLLSPLGFSPTGEVFNIAHDNIATEVACAIQAHKLIFLTEQHHFPDASQHLPTEYSRFEIESLLQQPERLSSEAKICFESAIHALNNGVERVHLLPYSLDGVILREIFTHSGAGTIIVEDSLKNIRPAHINDVNAIAALIQPLENNGTLIRRGRSQIERDIQHFYVSEHDKVVFACGALYVYAEEKMAEMACLTVDPLWQGSGEAEKMMRYIEKSAIDLGIETLFVLTTRTAHWFLKHGFQPASVDDLPAQKKAVYDTKRNSKIFTKSLGKEPT